MEPGDVVYESGPVRVNFAREMDEYDLFFGDAHVYLGRGILEEITETTDPIRLRESLERLGGYDVASAVEETSDWNMARLGWALSQAQASEIERERDYYMGELRQAAR